MIEELALAHASGCTHLGGVPILRVTNWSSPRHHGPGRRLGIMARPRPWEHGDGSVGVLAPLEIDLLAVKAGRIGTAEYRRRFGLVLAFGGPHLGPGELRTSWGEPREVQGGDTLLCCCSVAAAEAGECHRVWAAEALAKAGWLVVLDGKPLASVAGYAPGELRGL